MNWTRSALTIAILVAVSVVARAQDDPNRAREIPTKNPLEGNQDAVRAGQGIFRARCADCHGMDARGIRSPDLTQIWASGRTDDGLYRTLRNGVPGTEMPSVGPRTPDDE